jgi:nicotinamidase-related amidase
MAMDLVLDPKTTALVLIDLQQGIVAREADPHSSADVVKRSVELANAFRRGTGMVVLVRVLFNEVLLHPVDQSFPRGTPPPNAMEFVPEVGVQPSDVVIEKRQWGAFYGTQLDQVLRRRGIKTIVIGGIATNIGVESTAREAFDRGYQMVFAEDAMSSIGAEAHEFAVKTIFPLMGRVRSVDEIVKALG